ncbi:MAG: hypothetical protein QM530_01170 [Phycisphaerales bacterium]|nr:hypothetical protein [Phycisphaerales bacterium]
MEEHINPTYLKGFNDGYILSKHEPAILSGILKSDNPANEFLKALKAGQKQFETEKILEMIKQGKENTERGRKNEIEK